MHVMKVFSPLQAPSVWRAQSCSAGVACAASIQGCGLTRHCLYCTVLGQLLRNLLAHRNTAVSAIMGLQGMLAHILVMGIR